MIASFEPMTSAVLIEPGLLVTNRVTNCVKTKKMLSRCWSMKDWFKWNLSPGLHGLLNRNVQNSNYLRRDNFRRSLISV